MCAVGDPTGSTLPTSTLSLSVGAWSMSSYATLRYVPDSSTVEFDALLPSVDDSLVVLTP